MSKNQNIRFNNSPLKNVGTVAEAKELPNMEFNNSPLEDVEYVWKQSNNKKRPKTLDKSERYKTKDTKINSKLKFITRIKIFYLKHWKWIWGTIIFLLINIVQIL